jgi:mRNA-degrading endonuclease RelE of RelBE toxin-antitoxin system
LAHTADPEFWRLYRALPKDIQDRADKAFLLLQQHPQHPSLRLKKAKGHDGLWSARIGLDYRVLATGETGGLHWFWIGSHAEYDRILAW